MLVNPVQFLNAEEPTVVRLSGNVMFRKLAQLRKALSPMDVMPDGRLISDSALQSENVPISIIVTFWGISTCLRLVQEAKAYLPIDVREADKFNVVSAVQSWKADDPMLVTLLGILIEASEQQP